MTREELAWCAGFFDGEGYVGVARRIKPKPNGQSRGFARGQILISQVDRRVLDRFQRAVGVGKVFGPYLRVQERHQPFYMFRARGCENIQAIVAMLWEWLSPVKREQGRAVLAVINPIAPHTRYRTHCRKGHPFIEENIYRFVNGNGHTQRLCKACNTERNARRLWRSKKRMVEALLASI